MARRLDTLDDKVHLNYGQFLLRGVSDLRGVDKRDHLAEFEGQVFLYARGGEYCRIRVESWDVEPPPLDGPGSRVATARCVAETGIVAVPPYMFAGSGLSLLAGPSFFEYGLHLYAHKMERLLRLWPIRDVFDPALHLRPEGAGPEDMPSGRGDPPRSKLTDWPIAPLYQALDGEADTLDQTDLEKTEQGWINGRKGLESTDDGWQLDAEVERRLDAVLGDLRPRLLTRPPTWLLDTDEAHRRRYLNELRSAVTIAQRLNPLGRPTFLLPREDLGDRPSPGLSYRVWQWRPLDSDPGTLTMGRQVRARDVLRRRELVTGLVTVLREENGQVQVRDAIGPEAARVLSAEKLWSSG